MEYQPFSVGVRSASDARNLLKAVTDFTIGVATQGYFDPAVDPGDVVASCLVNADLHDLAARHGGRALLTDDDEDRLRGQGRDDLHIMRLRRLIAHEAGKLVISDVSLRQRLEDLGIVPRPGPTVQDRLLMHRGISEGQRRAMFFNDPRVVASGDQLGYLVEQGGALTTAGKVVEGAAAPLAAGMEPQVPTAVETGSPLLSTVLDGVVNGLVRKGAWSAGVAEDARRLLKQFVWTVGDKPCCDYNQTHVSEFRDALWEMPKTVRVQRVWHVPYAQAAIDWPKIAPANRRSNKTLNKDLSYMASFTAEMVATGRWTKGVINPLALAAVVSIKEKQSGRVPWTPDLVRLIFQSPVYSGNGGSKRRLISGNAVPQDAAFWMPLFGSYQFGRRDEHAGHLVTDFVFNAGTPHLHIRPNHLRDLKTEGSERFMPIHPRLLDLGLQYFVEAAMGRGEEALFAELWINAVKKGGAQYYGIAWCKLVSWLRKQPGVIIPTTTEGKEADFHSLRSTGLSQLDRGDINQNIVVDLAGHAREGTTAGSYQKLFESGGLEDVLQERLKVLLRLPDYAAAVKRPSLQVLPTHLRTR